MKTYFVTGATGTVGAALVPRLLLDDDAQIRLLIRAESREHLQSRFEELLSFWGESSEGILSRIKAIRGDAVLPYFGMSPGDYDALAGECTHIIHSSGAVRMNLPLAEARELAVGSAKNIAALAHACNDRGRLRKVEFVSTIGVGGKMAGAVPEAWIDEKREFHNTYEEAKAEAESYIARELEAGLPITVHRPSMVVGDSRTGRIIHFQVFYHICEFLSGRRTLGVLPAIRNTRLDTVPADYVARAIAWSSGQDSTIGKIVHLCSGPEEAIEIDALAESVRKIFRASGENLPGSVEIPLGLFKAGAPVLGRFVPRDKRSAMQVLPYLFAYMEEKQSFANSASRQMLKRAEIELPLVNEYLGNVLRYYLQRRKAH